MKTIIQFGLTTLLAGFLVTATAAPKDDVLDAAKKLGEKANYSWTTTVVVPEGSRFRPGPAEGKTEKDGCTHLKMTIGDNTIQAVFKGDKAAITNPDVGWQSLTELDTSEGRGRFASAMLKSFKTPAAQAAELVAGTKELKKDGDAYASDLTEDAAKPLLTFGRRSGGEVTVSDAKGSVKFWIKDGLLSKYEFKVSGKVTFNGNERDVDRTTTTEVKDVGTTKVEVPEEAKKKLEAPAAAK
jgi:hypothetical protein